MNFAGLSGRLVRLPEFRFLNSDHAPPSCTIRLAVDKRLSAARRNLLEQQGHPTADFFTVLCFDAPARFLKSQAEAGHLPPGTPLDVTGRLEQQTWTDRTTGAPRSAVVLRAREVRFAGRRRSPKPLGEDALRPSVASPAPLAPNTPSPNTPSTDARPEEILPEVTGPEEILPERAVTASSAEEVPETPDPLASLPTHPVWAASYFGTDDLEAFNPFLDMIGDSLG